jgi:glycerol-1-phosphate dehydrogenase [NAD(P)+]
VDIGSISNLEKIKRYGEEIKTDFFVGVGGGSKIDLAKKAAYDLCKPFISIPTTASHDGIVSPRASLKDHNSSVSLEAAVPIGIIADTGILVKAPYRNLIAGAADLIANYTAVRDWELAEKIKNEEFSSSAFALAKYASEEIFQYCNKIKPDNEESVWLVIKNLIFSGVAMSIAGSSRPASGSEHLFAHAIEKTTDNKSLHGEIVGVGTIIMSYLQGQDWQKVKDTLQRLGAPTTAKDLNLKDEEVLHALTIAHTIRNRYTILGDEGLSKDAAEKAVRATGVIS